MAAAKISGIYEIVNTLSGKRYVGSAVNLRIRRSQHFTRLRHGKHHSRYLQNAWDKYGEDAFVFRVISRCAPDQLLSEEQREIDRKSEYNMTKAAGSCLGRVLSEETKAKIAAAHTGKKHAPRSEEHRRNISAALKGKPKSASTMTALQAARRAYEFTDEDKAARSEGMRRAYAEGRRVREKSSDHCAKIADTLRTQSTSPDVRKRLSEQARQAWVGKSDDERRKHMEMVRAFRGKKAKLT